MIDLHIYIGQELHLQIDRPLGSRHPLWETIYPLNYGFVPGIISPDGEALDAYLLGVFVPMQEYTGSCIAIIRRLAADDDKLIVVPAEKIYNDDQIRALTEFQERFFQIKILP